MPIRMEGHAELGSFAGLCNPKGILEGVALSLPYDERWSQRRSRDTELERGRGDERERRAAARGEVVMEDRHWSRAFYVGGGQVD